MATAKEKAPAKQREPRLARLQRELAEAQAKEAAKADKKRAALKAKLARQHAQRDKLTAAIIATEAELDALPAQDPVTPEQTPEV